MKIYINRLVLFLSLTGIILFSCEEEDKFTYKGEALFHFTETSYNYIVLPDDTEGYDVGVGTTTANGATVQVDIDESSTAIEGVHFETINKSISIGEGEFVSSINILPIQENLDEAYTLTLNISNSDVSDTVSFNQSFTMTIQKFCPFDLDAWVAAFTCTEPGYGDYTVNFSVGTEDNTIVADNFWDFGGVVTYTLSPSESPDEAIVTIEEQTVAMGGNDYLVLGSGTYEQCSGTMVVDYQVLRPSDRATFDDNTHTFVKQ